MSADEPGFGLYVHWPFCLKKCPYCDFNSHVRDQIDAPAWTKALLTEIDYYAGQSAGRVVTSVFFGGGTPSLMPPATVAAILDRIGQSWPVAANAEITLEANPTSIELQKFRDFRAAGINRVSIGVQALDDQALAFLGRAHTAREALAALDLAASVFERYSFDLIYARPRQTLAEWAAELDQAIACAGDHLSVYQLTIEAGTAFHTAYARGDWPLPEDDLAGALFELTQDRLAAAGMPGYEISNHARPGQASRHNLTYWRYGDYIGIGPGAHGRLSRGGDKIATQQKKTPEAWLAEVARNGHGTESSTALSALERGEEALMMGLRLAEGIPLVRLEHELGRSVQSWLDPNGLALLIEGGFVTLDANRLCATAAGRQRLNAVLRTLLVA